ncbi:hypothetical protein OH76DRAFT_1412886 [Lentinus brumalis]|uniref:F-box domain-containing protein n=1 Tax=Lentinus brumalis TaxID=2498619 RepID=A0A371CJV8_9APHY|nr:hypothetical protein OH76DRAFT_1412886 [Polyporus brumalis]
MTRLLPLFQVLPTFTQIPTKARYVLTGRITPEHWQRFFEYASRIRELRYDGSDDNLLSKSSAFPHIMHRLQHERSHLVPRMRSLSYALAGLHKTSLLLLLSPALEKLELCCTNVTETGDWSNAAQGAALDLLVDAVCTSCPSLRDLKLRFLRSPLPLHTAATGLTNLRTLELPDSFEITDIATLHALAALPQLEALHDLRLKLPRGRSSPLVAGFRSLKDLSLIGDADDVLKFLQSVLSSLERVDITSSGLLSSWLRAYRSIAPLLKFVRELVIHHAPVKDDSDISEVEITELLQPLFRIRNMQSFCVVLRTVGLVADDDMFETIAKSWPYLTRFWLDVDPSLSTPTFLTLSAFATHCRALRTLVLPHVDHAALAFVIHKLKPPHPQTSLRRLSFSSTGRLRIGDPRAAAELLIKIFPMLDVHASAMLPHRARTLVDEVRSFAYLNRELQREDGAVLWGSVLSEVKNIQDGELRIEEGYYTEFMT